MLPLETQPVLDRWSQGLLSRDEFLRESRWYVHWSMNFGFYEKIFEFAKANRVPLYALNAPREVITKVRLGGRESLAGADGALVPPLDLGLEDHRALMRAIFGESQIPHEMKGGEAFDKMFEGLYRAQVAWDEVMAANAVRGAEASKARLVVLAGSGHMIYGLGINRRVYDRNHLPFATVVAVPVGPAEKEALVARSLADYVFGISEEERPVFPTIGLALKKFEGLDNPVVERRPIDGAALGQDFEKGDVILSVDGRAFPDINELRMYLAGFKWDEECRFRLLRGAAVKDVVLKLRGAPAENPEKQLPKGVS
jgi:aminopeptidase N